MICLFDKGTCNIATYRKLSGRPLNSLLNCIKKRSEYEMSIIKPVLKSTAKSCKQDEYGGNANPMRGSRKFCQRGIQH